MMSIAYSLDAAIAATLSAEDSSIQDGSYAGDQPVGILTDIANIPVDLLSLSKDDRNLVRKVLAPRLGKTAETLLVGDVLKLSLAAFAEMKSVQQKRVVQLECLQRQLVELATRHLAFQATLARLAEDEIRSSHIIPLAKIIPAFQTSLMAWANREQVEELTWEALLRFGRDKQAGNREWMLFLQDLGAWLISTTEVTCAPVMTSLADFDLYFTDGIHSFIGGLDDARDKAIVMQRWNLIGEKSTLEEVSQEFNCTRERIRQIQVVLETKFRRHLALPVQKLRQILEVTPFELLEGATPRLHALMQNSASVKMFLERMAMDAGLITETPLSLLHDYLAITPAPITRQALVEYLRSLKEEDETVFSSIEQVENTVAAFIRIGALETRPDGILVPRNLPWLVAIGHVLSGAPNGLTQNQIFDIVTETRLRGDKGASQRVSGLSHAFDNGIAYASGKQGMLSVYRHVQFIKEHLSEENIALVLGKAITYLHRPSTGRSQVPEFCRHCLPGQDPAVVAFILRNYSDSPLGWDGANQAQNFFPEDAQTSRPRRLTNETRMLGIIRKKRTGASCQEIVDEMGKTPYLVNVVLHRLVTQGKVLRMAPDCHRDASQVILKLGSQFLETVRKHIQELLATGQHVHVGYLRCRVNNETGKGYHKDLYCFLIRHFAKEEHYDVAREVFAPIPLRYASVAEAVEANCRAGDRLENCLRNFRNIMLVSDHTLFIAYSNWQAKLAAQ